VVFMIKRELSIFLVVGLLTVLVDFGVYRGLIWLAIGNINLAKGTSFIVGTTFAYFANRFWTFGQKFHAPGSLWRFVFLYSSTLIANVVVNAMILELFSDVAIGVKLAFLLATGVSASLNFFGMKLFVFKSQMECI
jgi:putative flippase GtrA